MGFLSVLQHRTRAILVILSCVFFYTTNSQVQTNVPALKDVYRNDFYIGCLLSYRHVGFPDDPYVPGQSSLVYPNGDGGVLIRHHMNSMSPGNNMKPQYTVDIVACSTAYAQATSQQAKDSIDVHPIVRFNGDLVAQLNWAQRNGFTFRGHTLVWYSQTPGTAFFRTGYTTTGARLSKEKMTQRMENYIKEVIRLLHEGWPGLLSAFDVVNEAVEDNGNDRVTNNEWYTTFGDHSYIVKAFEFARKYTLLYNEPQIKLYYNDYNTHLPAKADGIVRICGPLFRAGILDGIGMQEHDALTTPTAEQWIASYNKFDTICTEMAVTELDVKTGANTNWPSETVLKQQANQYAQLFKCFVERSARTGRGKIVSVSKDGLNDKYTFVTNQSTSLWDENNQCKPAFYAVVTVGRMYNRIDSLLRYVSTLRPEHFTGSSWLRLQNTVSYAQAAMNKNYSYMTAAADTLTKANDSLQSAVNGLVLTTVTHETVPSQSLQLLNYPNPFNPTTRIQFTVPQRGYVRVSIYNLLGQEVSLLVDGYREAGTHEVIFDARDYAAGIYICTLETQNSRLNKKLVLMK
ncbi:MAG: endo-1,4-beta-xylanase [Bacteroidetes bacterium]|nr:endo-1,4-beta-xylanase [Bacteroidota bacterium]